MHPILLSIGPFHIFSIGVFLILAWCAFSFILWKLLREQAVSEEIIFDITFYSTIVGLVSARIGFALIHPELFSNALVKIPAVWVQPGLSIYSGLVGFMLTLIWLSRRRHARVGIVLDSLALALPISFILGAVGTLLDGSELGRRTSLPWAVTYSGQQIRRHPLGLYEIIIFFLLFCLIWRIQKLAQKYEWPYGLVGVWFFVLFSFSMFFLEFVKEHTVYLKGLNVNQWLLVGLFGQAIGALYVRGDGKKYLSTVFRKAQTHIARKGKILYDYFNERKT